MIVSIKKGPHGALAIITDSEIVGKIYSEGKLQLDFTKEFYAGEEKTAEEVKKIIGESQHLHLSGEKSVALGLELNLVDKERILWVKGVPHAEVVFGS